MDIQFNSGSTLESIQRQFQKRFPYLKLEFFNGPAIPANRIDSSVHPFSSDVNFHVTGLMTVHEVEKLFSKKIKFTVEVFRKAGAGWLKTSSTDSWTLDEQNSEGAESLKKINGTTEPMDYQEQE